MECMRYPYLFYSDTRPHRPVFEGLHGDPLVVDMSSGSELLKGLDPRDQAGFQKILEREMQGGGYQWGVASYLENRENLLADCPQMVADQRFFHLGLDVFVGLGTPLHAPLEAVVQETGYETGEGNYGGYVLLKHQGDFETFYSFYGHLCKDRLPEHGTRLAAGEAFAEIGDFHENGNWFYHTHIQVITALGLEQGYTLKGYCSKDDLAVISELCPSPLPLFII